MSMIMAGTFVASCGDDEDPLVPPTQTSPEDATVTSQDPDGTIVINMSSAASGNFYDIGLSEVKIHIDGSNNFVSEIVTKREPAMSGPTSVYYYDCNYYVEFASLGNVSGLGQVNTFPTTGWSKSVAAVEGYGYVARIIRNNTFYGRYTRLYIAASNGNEKTVKYQTPFEIAFSLEKTAVALSHQIVNPTYPTENPYVTGTKESINIINGTKDIKVQEKPDWCYVSVADDVKSISVSANKNPNTTPRSGTIILKNSVCSATVSVTQDVAPEGE